MTAIVLDVRQVHAKYGKREVLSGVSLQAPAGEWFCLLGPNGVGKSTLLRCIGGALAPTSGDLLIAGHSIIAEPLAAKRHLGYACAPEQLPGLLTGRQCLEVYAQAKGLQALDDAVLTLAVELRLDGHLDGFVDTYSLGTRQKLCILLALLGEPALIVLDEAFNGLDPASALLVKHHLQQRLSGGRCAVLLATHSLDIVEHYADKAALLIEGRIVREWNESEIAAYRVQGDSAMETALAAAYG
ncbi:ABC transporter ATP-binding protein [Steroidobacter agaridevorans]|uniref:ABC transporter ATP-binding protein n=1 Tax=Steroidobacter agaridevorans TaxID=2695856 RepID=A0A829YNQ9_9GAMM|nr:ABC transporter ATP-binding protein [Steroidobacter agaridevorans]GFE84126.1 ABC transporter ATP-binding protein [Steroidobacter agaridevorans]GFE86948.1 ABC transporter ATP-binding protein [Steroidobacter agaridevorans]